MKVCGRFSVHLADDIRIVKEARSPSRIGHHALPRGIPVRAIELGLAGQAAAGGNYNCEHDAAELKNFHCGIFS
jgi:hypothetical protein